MGEIFNGHYLSLPLHNKEYRQQVCSKGLFSWVGEEALCQSNLKKS